MCKSDEEKEVKNKSSGGRESLNGKPKVTEHYMQTRRARAMFVQKVVQTKLATSHAVGVI